MKTNFLLKIVNPILAVVFLFQITTGLMHGIISRELFGKIHGGNAGVLMVWRSHPLDFKLELG